MGPAVVPRTLAPPLALWKVRVCLLLEVVGEVMFRFDHSHWDSVSLVS